MVHFLFFFGTQLVPQRRGLLEKLAVADLVKKMESKDHYHLQ